MSGTPPAGSAGNTYTFTGEVTDGQQTVSKQFALTVRELLRADFEATPTRGAAPLTVNFTDKSTGNPTSWQWDFDNDGTPDSTDQNPTWTYSSTGWYTVKLTISNGPSSNTCVKEKYILVAGGTYYVDGVNGDDANSGTSWSDAFATIGKALSVAGDYDLVLVADATYNETNLHFDGKKICLRGVDHNNAGQRPVIDCQQAGRAFVFSSRETRDSVIDNFAIQNGKAKDGGAIYCGSGSPTIINCTFSDNSAENYGGAICCWNSSNASIVNCVFSGNRTMVYHGGAIACYKSSPSISECTFTGNESTYSGGAILCLLKSSPTVTNCIFSGNNAVGTYGSGGAIYCNTSSSPNISNCVFVSNSAHYRGGAMRCDSSSSPTLTNCTFSGNSAGKLGGVLYCWDYSRPTFNNCILWNNSASLAGGEIYADTGCTVTLNYCCVDNTGYDGAGTIDDANNCIHSDPQFVDPASGDYHLKDTSPCIDAGGNTLLPSGLDKDLDGNPRIANGVVDIGAYEKQ